MLSDILKNKKCFKLVCGAGNEDLSEVEKLVYVYSNAGCNLFDLSANPEVIRAAKSGLKKAGISENRYLCVSVGIKGDPHTNKAVINQLLCKKCGVCQKICPQEAIFEGTCFNYIKNEKCIGCARCIDVCKFDAISFVSNETNLKEVLPKVIEEGIECIEFHAITDDDFEIFEKWNTLNEKYNGFLSICVDRSKLSNEKLLERLSKMLSVRAPYSTIVQADGAPMSGGKDDYNSTLQAVATAEVVQGAKFPVYILLSGGTNSKSSELASICDIDISGVAIGSYARLIVRDCLCKEDFWENDFVRKKAIETARCLVDKIFKWL